MDYYNPKFQVLPLSELEEIKIPSGRGTLRKKKKRWGWDFPTCSYNMSKGVNTLLNWFNSTNLQMLGIADIPINPQEGGGGSVSPFFEREKPRLLSVKTWGDPNPPSFPFPTLRRYTPHSTPQIHNPSCVPISRLILSLPDFSFLLSTPFLYQKNLFNFYPPPPTSPFSLGPFRHHSSNPCLPHSEHDLARTLFSAPPPPGPPPQKTKT